MERLQNKKTEWRVLSKAIVFCFIFYQTIVFSGEIYRVKTGDTLSAIAFKKLVGRIYGNQGSLKKLLALNTEIKNPDLIYPGDEIKLNLTRPATVEVDKVSRTLAKVEDHKKLDFSSTDLEIGPEYSLLILNSEDRKTGNQSTVASKIYAGLQARYLQNWNPRFRSFLGLKLGFVSFESPSDSSKSLSGGTKLLSTFSLGGIEQINDKLSLGASVNYGKKLFVRGVSTTNASVDSINIAGIDAFGTYEVLNLNSFSLNLNGKVGKVFGTSVDSYSVLQGMDYSAKIEVREKTFKPKQMRIGIEFEQRDQGTSVTKQTERLLTLSVQFYFHPIKF